MSAPSIAADTAVTLSYVLFDEKGEPVDSATTGEPLTYIHGYAQLVPGLERQIEGLKAGDKGVFTVEADEAFGEREDDAIFAVDKSDFPEAGAVSVGDEFMAEGPDGEPISMRVLEVRDDAFVVDTNHPLAGQRVRFEVTVSDVRPASEEEIAEAQAELEEMIADEHGCCDHDHDHDHEHGHDHDHSHPHEPHEHGAPDLVQLLKKKPS
jgi:FKBP-type peptidyl-prolyl cis-trans isomerase SlyD